MKYLPVTDCKKISLNNHALIEASAGTGKTYTIENLVTRFLVERDDLSLENILLVTYTEKATCELKIRIRENLEKLICENTENKKETLKLKTALDAFDTSSIYTIHGFCNTILTDFAFESRTLFKNQLINDTPLFEQMLKEQMRKDWADFFGDDFSDILNLSGFNEKRESFLSIIVNIAARVYKPGVGDKLIPDFEDTDFYSLKSDLLKKLVELKEIILCDPLLSQGYEKLNINLRTKKSLKEKIVIPLEEFFQNMDDAKVNFNALSELIDQIKSAKTSDIKGIDALIPVKWLKKGNNITDCPGLEKIVEKVKSLTAVYTKLVYFLSIWSIKKLVKDTSFKKTENGWISYDDMLLNVDLALNSANSETLLTKLRQKYKVAFVDEFQDTDPIQWRIFKKIFLEKPLDKNQIDKNQNFLFLIGDPKQAIYSFRGADIFAYLDAKKEMEFLSENKKANLYTLAENWRSTPELIEIFNKLFICNTWFGSETSDVFSINYKEVLSPGKKNLPESIKEDQSLRPALNIIDLKACETLSAAKPYLAKFITDEIIHIIHNSKIVIRKKDGEERDINYGDICILVRGKPDIKALEPEFIQKQIPYSFYKKPGLFTSIEAEYLNILFCAVADPENMSNVKKALLTPFFNCKTADLYKLDTLSVFHPIKKTLFLWNRYAETKKISTLFKSIMEESGIIFRESGSLDWERTVTNYNQLLEFLEIEAYSGNLDFNGIMSLLDCNMKNLSAGGEDADIHQTETREKKVQIMTMHVSKGLQFPVVFIGGGLTKHPFQQYNLYHQADKNKNARKIIDITRNSGINESKTEQEGEDKRLFYVALTRAQFKLYIPYFPNKQKSSWIGPLAKFVSFSLEVAFLKETSSSFDFTTHEISKKYTDLPPAKLKTSSDLNKEIIMPDPILPSFYDYRKRVMSMESFSSLHKRKKNKDQLKNMDFYPNVEKTKENDEDKTDADELKNLQIINKTQLPSSADIGLMFHEILETVDYQKAKTSINEFLENSDVDNLISGKIKEYFVDPKWKSDISQIIFNVLTAEIPLLKDSFKLTDIDFINRQHETEFYFYLDVQNKNLDVLDIKVENLSNGSYVRGIIDLIFSFKGKYYIADWKSNFIESGYKTESLNTAMDDFGYKLQYKIYTIALLRWLGKALGNEFDYKKHFGGVFYFFIRGMSKGKKEGIYFVPPDKIGNIDALDLC